jgi:CheY-like chemotaxis protein
LHEHEFYGDKTRFRQILINLLGNAVKFTPSGSISVVVKQITKEDAPYLSCAVTDTGIGIPEEKFDLIFERFKQGDSRVSRRYGGTGLGLSISRNLAELMGGDLMVQSEVGKGSTFTLLLPMRDAQEHTADDDSILLDDDIISKMKAPVTNEDCILLVEDYEGNIAVLSYLLDDLGCSYDVARTGLEGLNKWKEKRYDIVLIDIQMPEMDGFEATAIIRDTERRYNLPRTPIIGMTAHALMGDRDKCIESGMDAYLPKPIVEADLKREIFDYLMRKRRAAA